MRLNGKVAIVTGGSRGIGRGICLRFAQEGAALIINYYDDDDIAANNTLEEITKSGGKAILQKIDIRNEEQVEEMARCALDEFGKIDILVNNAGVIKDRFVTKMSIDDWNYVIDINLKGAFLCTRSVLKYMIPVTYGKIVNIASRAMWGSMGQVNYAASKGGLVSMTRALAIELARYNINANCVAPGVVHTDMINSLKETIKERLLQAQPTRKFGTPQDIANAVLFLASDESNHITGETILVDGGKQIAAGAMGRIIN